MVIYPDKSSNMRQPFTQSEVVKFPERNRLWSAPIFIPELGHFRIRSNHSSVERDMTIKEYIIWTIKGGVDCTVIENTFKWDIINEKTKQKIGTVLAGEKKFTFINNFNDEQINPGPEDTKLIKFVIKIFQKYTEFVNKQNCEINPEL